MKNQIIIILSLLSVSLSSLACDDLGRKILKTFSKKYETDGKVLGGKPIFIGPDAQRKQLSISLQEVVKVKEPTDIQFPPGDSPFLFVLEKAGDLILFDRDKKNKRVLKSFQVITDSEEGLLGFTFHPKYPKEPKVYTHTVISSANRDMTVIAEWEVENPNSFETMALKNERVLLEVEQPYPNHNGGQITFGPDGHLYIGLGMVAGGLIPKITDKIRTPYLAPSYESRLFPIRLEKNLIPFRKTILLSENKVSFLKSLLTGFGIHGR